MTYIEISEEKVERIRKRQSDFTKCVDKFFDASVDDVLRERYDYQMKCHHNDMIEENFTGGGGHKRCPECGWECWWGSYKEPEKPLPYPHEKSVERLLKRLQLLRYESLDSRSK